MGPKSTLRLMRIIGPSLASLVQSSWGIGLHHFIFSFNFHATLSLSPSPSFSSSIEASALRFLSKALCWWWSFSFDGLFSSGWRLLSPLLLYLPLQLHGWKSPLKDLIEAQRSSLYRSFSSKLPSVLLLRTPCIGYYLISWDPLNYGKKNKREVIRRTYERWVG